MNIEISSDEFNKIMAVYDLTISRIAILETIRDMGWDGEDADIIASYVIDIWSDFDGEEQIE